MEGHCSTGQSPQWAVVPMEGGGGGGGVTCSVQSVQLTMRRKYKFGLSHQCCHDCGCVKATNLFFSAMAHFRAW